jgi:hypothetical protein
MNSRRVFEGVKVMIRVVNVVDSDFLRCVLPFSIFTIFFVRLVLHGVLIRFDDHSDHFGHSCVERR